MFVTHFTLNRRGLAVVTFVLAAILLTGIAATAQGPQPQGANVALGSGFTYQGQLRKNNLPLYDTCNLTFSLWDAQGAGSPPTGGTQLGGNQPMPGVSVVNGLFTRVLNDAGQFGANAFNGQERWLQVAVQCTGDATPVTLSRQPVTAAPYAQYATGNWGLNGNAGTNASNFIGTTDNMSLTLGVNVAAALRIYPNPNTTSPNLIGGSRYNTVTVGAVGATIGGGGRSNYPNRASDSFATVSGGYDNSASGEASTVGGGESNRTSNFFATVGGGYGNSASGDYSSVSGGDSNTASGGDSTVSGGDANTASGNASIVSGGESNLASGQFSFAAGHFANAVHGGAFVWADNSNQPFTSGGSNHFDVRATGGISLVTSIDGGGNPTSGLFVSNAGKATVNGLKVSSSGTQFNRILGGTATLGSGSTGVNAYTVTFPVTFSAIPKVLATPRGGMFLGNTVSDTFAVTTREVTTSYFVVNVYFASGNGSLWSQNLQLDWFAWE